VKALQLLNPCKERGLKVTALKWIVVVWVLVGGLAQGVETVYGADSGSVDTVLILPPALYGPDTFAYLRSGTVDMLSTRLADPGKVAVVYADPAMVPPGAVSPSQALELAAATGADHVIFGSITLLGTAISTDLRMARVSSGNTEVAFSRSGTDPSALIGHIDGFADEVRQTVLHTAAKQPAAAAAPVPVPPAGGTTETIHQHPEKLLQQPPGEAGVAGGGLNTMLIGAGSAIRGPRLSDQARGIAMGDVDGDGRMEMVVAAISTVSVYRFADGRFSKLAVVEGSGNYIGVDTADLNSNGKDEIFITNTDKTSGQVQSFVLEYDGRDFQRIADVLNFYFRSIRLPMRGRVLHGQRRGVDGFFAAGIFEIVFENGRYSLGQRLKVPNNLTIFGIAVGALPGSPEPMVFAYNSKGQIVVTDTVGRQEWISTDGYGSVAAQLSAKRHADPGESDIVYVQGRIDVLDVDNDGINELVVLRNDDMSGSVFSRMRLFKQGRLEILKPDQLGMATRWRTRDLTKYISDFAVDDLDGDGLPEIALALVQEGKSVIGGGRSNVYIFKLDVTPAAAQ
jgi:hypothetical protein